jgi:hypothetical protein
MSVAQQNTQPGIEYFRHKDKLIGMCVRKYHNWQETTFLTPDDNYQQIGLLAYGANHMVKPHAHYKVPRNVNFTQEVLLCVSGRIVYTFYDEEDNWQELASCELTAGDLLCLFGAGHGGKALEPTRLIEIKQGPFLGVQDKYYYPEGSGK